MNVGMLRASRFPKLVASQTVAQIHIVNKSSAALQTDKKKNSNGLSEGHNIYLRYIVALKEAPEKHSLESSRSMSMPWTHQHNLSTESTPLDT
jgi:hypothetical protein